MSILNATKKNDGSDIYNITYWDKYYSSNKDSTPRPSTFATFIYDSGYLERGSTLLDVGCGNGRDTFYFLEKGVKALGIDGSASAIEGNQGVCSEINQPTDCFAVCDIMNGDLEKYSNTDSVYARFFLHAIPKEGQIQFFKFLRNSNVKNVFLEFRTLNDPLFQKGEKLSGDEGYTDHYRRFLNFEDTLEEISTLPYEIIYQIEAAGLSPHGDDDPSLGRIVLKRKGS